MTVVVMTQALDLTADTVILELAERGVPVFRFDRAWFPDRLTLDAELTATGWTGCIATASRSVALEDVRAVWIRWRSSFVLSRSMSAPDRVHATAEARSGFDGVLAGLDARYVNHPATVVAMTKPAELKLAIECDFAVPNTVISNSPGRVLDAARRGPVVRKLFNSQVPGPDGRCSVGHSRLPTESDLADTSSVRLTAHQVQQYIDKKYDLRVVAVGDRLFPVGIFPESAAARVDFRSDYRSLRHDIVDLPADVGAAIHLFMKRADLSMASFDLTVDRDGQHYFLESNPSGGQYGWLEHHTGAPISAALADLLASGGGSSA